MTDLAIEDAGDGAMVAVLGAAAAPARAVALAAALRADAIAGVYDVVPAFASVTVQFDPLATDAEALAGRLRALAATTTACSEAPRRWRIPACYEGAAAPDLAAVAAALGLAPDEVVARHTRTSYRVHLIGFLPGFAYMGDLDPALALPRRATPRTRVPAGSVAIAERMTAIYPEASPGGWHLLARSPVRLFDPAVEPPALLAPGDEVRFFAVETRELRRLEAAAAAGSWRPAPEAEI